MAQITVTADIEASGEEVWQAAADLGSHVEWMADARSIEFLTEQTSGVGTRMRVLTVVGPLRTHDVMEVTDWDEGHAIGVRHRGLVTGEGRFVIEPIGESVRFTWSEELSFPWYLGAGITAFLSAPILRRIWRRNLDGLRRRLERG